MFRYSLRGLIGVTTVIAAFVAICIRLANSEHPDEREIRLYGKQPMEDPESLFAEADRLATLGDEAQSANSVDFVPAEALQVYDSRTLPNMESHANDLRELDSFETTSLQRLYQGEDLCLEGHENRVRMFGSLRANRQCLDCHTVQRGELLGAFTNDFIRSGEKTDQDQGS
ncbi:MAG: hypothetical protein AAF802_24895 [Planctomycetota bacterium]